jgi:hypothetical protein
MLEDEEKLNEAGAAKPAGPPDFDQFADKLEPHVQA